MVTAFLIVAFAISISIGNGEDPPTSLAGFYTSGSTCLGEMAKLEQSGVFVDLDGRRAGRRKASPATTTV